MPSGFRILLSELSCLRSNPLSWPDRSLFIFVFSAGSRVSVEFAGPRWMVDGNTISLDPPQLLFSMPSRETNLAVAIRGEDLGRESPFDDTGLARAWARSAICGELAQTCIPGQSEHPWEAGLAAIDAGLERLVSPDYCRRPVFSFSKVYSTPVASEVLTLFHTISDETGEIASRYKLSLDLEDGEAGGPAAYKGLGRDH